MMLENPKSTWIVNLAVEAGSGILPRLQERNRVAAQLKSLGFEIVTEPENRVSAFRLRVRHRQQSAMTVFLLNCPDSVEKVDLL